MAPSGGRELDRVRHEVHHQLLELVGVGARHERVLAALEPVGDPLRRELRRHHRLHAGERLAHGDVRHLVVHLPGVELREVQHVVDEREQHVLAPVDPAERVALLVRHLAIDAELHDLRVAADRVERRAQLVAHHRQEIALRPVRPLRRPACLVRLGRDVLELLVRHLELLGHGDGFRHAPLQLAVRALDLARHPVEAAREPGHLVARPLALVLRHAAVVVAARDRLRHGRQRHQRIGDAAARHPCGQHAEHARRPR